MKAIRKFIIVLFATSLFFEPILLPKKAHAAGAPPGFTGIYKQNNYVKLEWATEMDPSDVLTYTSFETGQETPNTAWGGSNIHGNQSVATISGAATGSRVFQLTDTITNNMGNHVNPPQTYSSPHSVSTFTGKSIPSGSTISVSYKARAINSTTSNLYFSLTTGWYKRGYNLIDKNGKSVVFSERFDFNNPPINLPIRNSDGTVPDFKNGHVAILVSSKSQNHEYGVLRYTYNSTDRKFVKFDAGVWGDTYPLGQRPTVIKEVFNAGDNVLVFNQGTNSTPNRNITSNDWTTINANIYIADNPEYSPSTMGLAPRIYWSTDGLMQIDDLKFGYASEVEVYRDGNSIYRGYLSDYEDRTAIDRTAPAAPNNLKVSVGAGRKPVITWNPSADAGTTYNYQIKGHHKNSSPTTLSANNPITITSGIKGYSVVIDQNPNTIPPAVVTTTGTSYTGAAEITGNFYIHVAAVDNENNRSNVTHFQYTDTIKPILEFSIANTSWTNKPVTIRATAQDFETGIKRIQLPDKTWVNQSDAQYDVYQNGIYTFVAEDNAGNQMERSIAINNIDTEAPQITITPEEQEWTSKAITAQIDVSDLLSGVRHNGVYYKVTDTPAEPVDWDLLSAPNHPIDIYSEGQWYLYVRASDNAGNTNVVRSKVLQLQQMPTKPTQFKAADIAHDKVTLSWDLPPGNVYTHGYEYQVTNKTTGATYNTGYPNNQIIDQSVKGGTEYEYCLTVKNNVGQITSDGLFVVTKPEAPKQVHIEKVEKDYSKALLKIEPIVGATSYRVITKNAQGDVFLDEVIQHNEYLVQGMHPGEIYNIIVSGMNASGQGPALNASYLSLPDTPGGFTEIRINETSIDLEWNSVTTATYYNLERDKKTIFDESDLRFNDISLEAGTNYEYRVSAANDTGEGEYSDPLHLVTLPAKMINFSLLKIGANSAALGWEGVHGAESYTLNVNDGQTVTVTGSVYEAQLTNLEPGTTYQIQGYANNRSGQGETVRLSFETLPLAPEQDGTTVENIEEESAEISWNPVSGATKYRIKVNGQEYEVSTSNIHLFGLSGSKVYQFTIEAGNTSGYGAAAGGEFITKPHSITNLEVKAISSDSIQLAWDSDETATDYYVQIDGSNDVHLAPGPEVELKGLKPGENFNINIWAKNATGEGKHSTIQVTTLVRPVSPDDITISVEHEQVVIEFEPIEKAKEYVLHDENRLAIWRGKESPIVIKPIIPGRNYEYSIIAVNGEGMPAAPTEIRFIAIPSHPEGVLISNVTENSISFDFSRANLNGASAIIVYRDGEEIKQIALPLEEITFTDGNLKPKTTYNYEFKAVNKSGVSPESVLFSISTKEVISKDNDGSIGSGGNVSSPNWNEGSNGVISDEELKNEIDTEVSNNGSDQSHGNESGKTPYFTDVSEASFAAEAIAYLTDLEIIKGVTDTIFEPDRAISRMEFAALLVRAIHAESNNSLEITYQDINKDSWYMNELNAAIANEIAIGFNKTEFRPLMEINREQAAKMIGNVVIKKYNIDSTLKNNSFSDIDLVSSWAIPAVELISGLNILTGYPDGSLRPQGKLTRAESAVLIYYMIQLRQDGLGD